MSLQLDLVMMHYAYQLSLGSSHLSLLLRHLQFSSVQSLSRVPLFVTPWTAAHQASLFITDSQSLLKHMAIKSVML